MSCNFESWICQSLGIRWRSYHMVYPAWILSGLMSSSISPLMVTRGSPSAARSKILRPFTTKPAFTCELTLSNSLDCMVSRHSHTLESNKLAFRPKHNASRSRTTEQKPKQNWKKIVCFMRSPQHCDFLNDVTVQMWCLVLWPYG